MPHCPSCSAEISETARFCASCGASLNGDAFATRTVAASTPSSGPVSRVSRTSSSRAQGRFAPGALLGGRYRIISLLGKGGMGEVYRADDLTLDQSVALKFLPEAVAQHPESLARFRNEVRIARQVSHPNVCRVYDLGEMEGLYFLSMEYVDGEDLGSLLRRIGRLPSDKALEIARKLCAGLAAAHEKGVLHRDLKPANVMLDGRGQVLLTDFGLAGLAEDFSGAEVRNGTPAYMAPEQLAGEEVTVKSDIYALGLVLYEIFTGKLPFESTTLAALMRAQRESVPPSPASLVRDLDPMVERVILRCLQAKPSMRPPSALAVAAALPGGDPLAAALAAGETPSPEMVAAAGEGEGLSLRVALPLLLFVLGAVFAGYALEVRGSALATLEPPYGPEVLAQKARDAIQKLGGAEAAADEAWGFDWDGGLFGWFVKNSKNPPQWNEVLQQNPMVLRFWFRQASAPMTGVEFHDDMLTPGVVTWDDPPPEEAGMVRLVLDAQGRMVFYERLPRERLAPAKDVPQADWGGLFTLAGLDQSKFTPAEPLWTSLAAADTRMAWTMEAPRAIRVEAAALRGQPVFFARIEPWSVPGREPQASTSMADRVTFSILGIVLIVVCVAAALLARYNLSQQRGDRRGALRLAVFFSGVQLILWLLRGHILASTGTFGSFLVAMCTSVFYGVVIWTVYIALEPYVRRRWPQTLISWSAVLIGRLRDPVVGRDVLIGCAAGAAQWLLDSLIDVVWKPHLGAWMPRQDYLIPLAGGRSSVTPLFIGGQHAIREALFFFFLIFLLRVLLRNQWLAAAGFAAIFASLDLVGQGSPGFDAAISFIVLLGFAFVVLRWGVLAFVTLLLISSSVFRLPIAQTSSWYFAVSGLVLAAVAGLAIWAFRASLGDRKLWTADL
jgi:serine/threonine-protein kinase